MLAVIPFDWLRWVLVGIAAAISSVFLAGNFFAVRIGFSSAARLRACKHSYDCLIGTKEAREIWTTPGRHCGAAERRSGTDVQALLLPPC